MRILVIPEDFRYDQHILRPLFSGLFRTLGRRSVRVQICQEPLLGGIGEALKLERLAEIIDLNPMADIFVLCVDRDGEVGRRQRLDQIESEFRDDPLFLAENAWEEIETWMLAGLDLPNDWSWADVRAEVHVKETYFEPLAARRSLSELADGGRKVLGEEAARRISAIRQKCPEDFDALARRLENAVVIGNV